MTIDQIIDRCQSSRPDAVSDTDKAKWLTDLDEMIRREVIGAHELNEGETIPRPLAVEPPYDKLYDLYIFAMVDFTNREIQNYNNSIMLFNQAFEDWKRHYHRTHVWKDPIGQVSVL